MLVLSFFSQRVVPVAIAGLFRTFIHRTNHCNPLRGEAPPCESIVRNEMEDYGKNDVSATINQPPRDFLATTRPVKVFGRPANFFGSLLVGMVVMLLPDAVLHIKLIALSGRTGIETNRQVVFFIQEAFEKRNDGFPL